MPNIFYDQCTGEYFKRCKQHPSIDEFYLWKPVRKFLWFYVPVFNKRSFWLDDYGFRRFR